MHIIFPEYTQNGIPSIVLHFVDIRHGLHEFKKKRNIVRRRHIVLGVINEFPKNGMEQTQRQCRGETVGPIAWNVLIGLVLSEEEILRFPTIRRSLRLSLAAEFLPVLTYLVGG